MAKPLTDKQAKTVTDLIDAGYSTAEIHRMTPYSKSTIYRLRYGLRPSSGWTPWELPGDNIERPSYVPTPEEIKAKCDELKAGWTEEEWKQRSGWGEENERACLRGIGFASIGKNRYVVVS